MSYPINEKNIKKFIEEANALFHTKWTITFEGHPIEQHFYPFLFKFKKTQNKDFVVFDYFKRFDLFSDKLSTKQIIDLAGEYGWYPVAYTCGCDFTFGEI